MTKRGMLIVAVVVVVAALAGGPGGPAWALEEPWISNTYFYWYSWDYARDWGAWLGGVYNTPLRGYYDSARYDDNLVGLRQTAEWGMTHHFMDYWGPGWLGENGEPREAVLYRATEALRKEGYNLWMSVYQDGTDFDMSRFSANLGPGRDTEFYVNHWAHSPAQPTVNGKPVYLIYGRNGLPKLTGTDEGFREFLRAKYGDVAALNARWGSSFGSLAEIGFNPGAKGHQRAESIRYQYRLWQEEMGRNDEVAQARWGLPGTAYSWDVGYQPLQGFDYSSQARVFCGPHSYGGIFGVPHAEDTERLIQAAVAKRYDTVFFDTFKNFYHDWEIRIPGIAYPPAFNAFDRFWVQSLAHYSEALVHLSWNEWWEGSNLEPCLEYGKTYCEKNLLYSTIMRQCFGSIQDWNRGARVAVLLNDWHWLAGGRHPEDIYACIEGLRRSNIRFDVVPDDFVTREELGRFDVVLAPSGAVGFGENARGESIERLVLDWAAERPKRRLLVSGYPGLAGKLGVGPAGGKAESGPAGPDLSLFVDVGTAGDDRFLIEGISGMEDWAHLPPDAFGATDKTRTVRWTPGAGDSTSLVVPLSPQREHVLRLQGSSLWANRVTVLLDGAEAAAFDLRAGDNTYEVKLPAEAVGPRRMGVLTLKYARSNVPAQMDPEHYQDNRVCNLALDWVQLATANLPMSREQRYALPEAGAVFTTAAPASLAGKRLSGPYATHERLAPTGRVLSTHSDDGLPRDLVVGEQGNVLLVNGLFAGVSDPAYLGGLLREWAGCRAELAVTGKDLTVTRLGAGDTEILLAYNYAAPEARAVTVAVAEGAGRLPVAEVRVLSRDGEQPADRSAERVKLADGQTGISDRLDYYAVYEVARGKVGLDTPAMVIAPGQRLRVPVTLRGLETGSRAPVTGTVRLVEYAPSLTSEAASFSVAPGAEMTVELELKATEQIEWGRRTVVFDLETGGRHTYFWRQVMVQRLPELRVAQSVVDGGRGKLTVAQQAFPWAQDATATGVTLNLEATPRLAVGDVAPGKGREVALGAAGGPVTEARLEATPGVLRYQVGGVPRESTVLAQVARYPGAYAKAPGAVKPVVVCNPHETYLENALVSCPAGRIAEGYVRDARGEVVPSQRVGALMYWIAQLPPKSATVYTLCAGKVAQPATDLRVSEGAEGVAVSNGHLDLGWSGEQGGTLTTLRSRRTGLDYAAGACGGGFGSWGKYDPAKPAIDTVNFVGQERKTWQREQKGKARVRVVTMGPVLAQVEVEVKAPGGVFRQRYTLGAYQNAFRVAAQVRCDKPQQEVVALDLRLRRHGLDKAYPNFIGSGEGFTADSVHAGWREAPYIPPYSTLMEANAQRESLSILQPAAGAGQVSKFRQGFWPEKRPVAGPVQYVETEYAAMDTRSAATEVTVLLHPGYQVDARDWRRMHVSEAPTVILPERFRWEGTLAGGTTVAEDWWNAAWHYALPVKVAGEAAAGGSEQLLLKPDLRGALQGEGEPHWASPRAVALSESGDTVLPTACNPNTGEVTVELSEGAWAAGESRQFRLYFDTLANGPKRSWLAHGAELSSTLRNGSFEGGGEFWNLGGVTIRADGGRTGPGYARFEQAGQGGPTVVTNRTLRVEPQAQYRVRFWARTSTPGAGLSSNFYQGAAYDFPQAHVGLTPDGQWHEYTLELPTRDFPIAINPELRFWTLGQAQRVDLDDVTVELLWAQARPQAEVAVGALERR